MTVAEPSSSPLLPAVPNLGPATEAVPQHANPLHCSEADIVVSPLMTEDDEVTPQDPAPAKDSPAAPVEPTPAEPKPAKNKPVEPAPEPDPIDDGFADDDDGFNDDLADDDDLDEFDDIDEDDFDDGFDDDFEEELDDDYEIEIDDEISDEFGLSTGPPKESKEFEVGDFDDFDGMFRQSPDPKKE